MTKSVDTYFLEGCGRCPLHGTLDCKVHNWTKELTLIRSLVSDSMLKEESKWGVPCYTYKGKNVLTISAFKEYCCISFFKGVLLKDEHDLLVKPGPNSQSARLLKFNQLSQIENHCDTIQAYIEEAIDIERKGLTATFGKTPEPIPDELNLIFEEDPILKAAFETLTPGRQRGYILHISQAKQSKTRLARIEKCTPMILSGIGLHDKYSSDKRKN